VLSTPPAFVLSQDQTLHKKVFTQPTKKAGQASSIKAKKQSLLTIIHQKTKPTPKKAPE
jgi:hypothetical protein